MTNQPTPATKLTLQIVEFLNTHEHYATRIVTAGIYNEETGEWERSGAERGTADIHACINSVHVSIEIKAKRDKLRAKQLEVRQRIIKAGGQYIAIKTFQDFQTWYYSFVFQQFNAFGEINLNEFIDYKSKTA